MDVPRVIYASGGQSYPNPPPYDQVSLDNKVRHVGDRVAVVAGETREILQQALELIEVEYEVLPTVFDPVTAMQRGAPVIHDERDAVKIHDAGRNLVHHLFVNYGDVEAALATMKPHRVRRLPVEGFGGSVLGVVSLNDIVLATGPSRPVQEAEVVTTLQAICSHHHATPHVVTV